MRKIMLERGMVIIEASLVFPIMFLAIFFMFFMGNAYYQKCKVEAIVTELALDGAAFSASPLLRDIDRNGTAPVFGANNQKWRYYRYFTDMEDFSIEIKKELVDRLENVSPGLFSGMEPSASTVDAYVQNNVIYSTFCVDLDYRINIPIRLLGASHFSAMRVTTRAEAPVTDVPEFIRNVSMIEDYLDQTGASDEIQKVIQKAKDLFKGGD